MLDLTISWDTHPIELSAHKAKDTRRQCSPRCLMHFPRGLAASSLMQRLGTGDTRRQFLRQYRHTDGCLGSIVTRRCCFGRKSALRILETAFLPYTVTLSQSRNWRSGTVSPEQMASSLTSVLPPTTLMIPSGDLVSARMRHW